MFFQSVEVVPIQISVPAGSDIPHGRAVYEGARLRALDALDSVGYAEFGVGIEAGYVEILGKPMLTACCIILDRDGEEAVSYSLAFQPPDDIKPSGELGRGGGVVGVVTEGRVTREHILQDS